MSSFFTACLAVWGAVLGTYGAVLSTVNAYMTYQGRKRKLRVNIMYGWMEGSRLTMLKKRDSECASQPDELLIINVQNVGHATVEVHNVLIMSAHAKPHKQVVNIYETCKNELLPQEVSGGGAIYLSIKINDLLEGLVKIGAKRQCKVKAVVLDGNLNQFRSKITPIDL